MTHRMLKLAVISCFVSCSRNSIEAIIIHFGLKEIISRKNTGCFLS